MTDAPPPAPPVLPSSPASPDIAALAAGLGTALHAAGLPVGPDRCERLARAVIVMNARSIPELRACALATLVSDPGQMVTFESRRGAKMFERYGFRVINRSEISKYKKFHPEPVFLSTVVKDLGENDQLYSRQRG